jgi:hypothetical protein
VGSADERFEQSGSGYFPSVGPPLQRSHQTGLTSHPEFCSMNLARPEQADPAFGIDAHGVVYPGQLPTASFSRTHRALISHGKKMSALSGYRAVRTSRRRCRVTESPSSRQSSEQATGPKASVHVLKLGTALLRSRSSEVRTTRSSEEGRPGTGCMTACHPPFTQGDPPSSARVSPAFQPSPVRRCRRHDHRRGHGCCGLATCSVGADPGSRRHRDRRGLSSQLG